MFLLFFSINMYIYFQTTKISIQVLLIVISSVVLTQHLAMSSAINTTFSLLHSRIKTIIIRPKQRPTENHWMLLFIVISKILIMYNFCLCMSVKILKNTLFFSHSFEYLIYHQTNIVQNEERHVLHKIYPFLFLLIAFKEIILSLNRERKISF